MLHAQPYYFKHYEVTDGLSHNTIHCATQDDRGFMWFGTKNGLNRFDGYEFKRYQSDSTVSGSLGSNFIECLGFADGRLWVGTDNGLYTRNSRSVSFKLVAVTADEPILDLVATPSGELWVVAARGLRRIDPATGRELRHYATPNRQSALRVATSEAGEVFLATESALFRYRSATDDFGLLDVSLPVDTRYPLRFSALYSLPGNRLAVGTVSHGAFVIDVTQGTVLPLTESTDRLYVRDFLLREQVLWIGTEDGVFLYDLRTGNRQHLEKHAGRPYGLSDDAVYTLFEDRDRDVWIGTYFRGLNYYSEALTGFRKFLPVAGENSVSGSAVREMRQDEQGKIWVGTEDAGLNRFDPTTGQFTHFALEGTDGGPAITNIHGILVRGSDVWVGTFQNGLFVIDAGTGAIKRHWMAGEASGLRSNFIFSLYATRDGTVVAITASGLHRYDAETDRFELLEGFAPDYFYTSLLEDSDGDLWAGTYWDGLYHYDTREKQTTAYGIRTPGRQLGNDAINGIFEDSQQNIWVTTENGLNKLTPGSGGVEHFGTADGFPGNVFYAIQEDETGKLWMSTANGLVCYHPTSGRIDTYGTENGLPSNQFNYNSALTDAAGHLYFGTVKGYVSFDPRDARFDQREHADELVLTELRISGAPVGASDAAYRIAVEEGAVELPYDLATFSLSFSTLDYRSPGLTQYQYQLGGPEQNWVDLDQHHEIHFTNLHPGSYPLRLRVRGHNSDWSPPQDFLTLSITPPWWRSGWAYAAYVTAGAVLLLLVGYLYHRYSRDRANQRQRLFEHEKEKELYRAKIEFFTNVSHEILTPLTLIRNPVEMALSETDAGSRLHGTLSLVHRNTVRLVDLVKQLLDFRKVEMEHVSLSFVRADVAALLRDTLERHAPPPESGMTVTDNLGDSPVLAYVDAEAFRKITGNLVANAIKYGERLVDVRLEHNNDELRITVSNDGPGIPESEQEQVMQPFYRMPGHDDLPGTGLGLPLARSLAELHGGALKLYSGDRARTTFVVTLPLHHPGGFDLPLPSVETQHAAPVGTGVENARRPALSPTILLVEDNIDLLDFVAKELADTFTMLRATDGETALDVLQHHVVQLVVSDVKMPGIDGFTLCGTIKADVKLSHVPVILLTSKSGPAAEITGLESGADAYVTKPFAIGYLRARIWNLLDNRARIVEHFSRTPLAHLQSIAQSPVDEDFTAKLDAVIQDNLANPDLNVEDLADRMHMSRSTLYRKIKDISGTNPNDLINLVRLKKGAQLLKTQRYKVYEVALMVGYNSATSFGRNFKKQFNVSPGDYAKSDDLVT
ncbi:hybrid sensor histidine kinase/response regulator transcription factor [Neolewinella xylanilytica]|nr:hybrid sensor histidine kinase/response regulator transcription factor [Neolewinella xylanilytica]